jgi:hypothetical protein
VPLAPVPSARTISKREVPSNETLLLTKLMKARTPCPDYPRTAERLSCNEGSDIAHHGRDCTTCGRNKPMP